LHCTGEKKLRRRGEKAREPFAPIPVSQAPSDLRIGSWFQRHQKFAQLLAISGIATGFLYLTWRVLYTSLNIPLWSFIPLFVAELFGYFTYLIFVLEAWNLPQTPRLPPLILPCDIVIPSFNEDRDVLEPTIIGALEVRGDTTVWLLDDGRRPEMAELAEYYGINYLTREGNAHAKAGNINAALPKLTGELILIIDADHVPAPDFLEATTGYFADSNVALVQTAHSFRNHNSITHAKEGRNDQSLFFDVLLPGRNRTSSVLWCGSAAIIRRSALNEVGGLSTYSVIEDFETSLNLRRIGYRVVYHNEHLIQGLAPDNLNAHVIQKYRWAQGLFMLFRPSKRLPLRKELGTVERISYFGGFLYYITPYQKLLYIINLICVAIFGLVPVGYVGGWYLLFWGSATAVNLLAVTALERGTSHPFESLGNTFITMESYLKASMSLFSRKSRKFVVTPKGEIDLGGIAALKLLRLPITLSILTFIAIVFAWFNYYSFNVLHHQAGKPLSLTSVIIISLFGGLEIYIVLKTSWKMYHRKQFRELWRFPVRLRAFINGEISSCIDLHQHGAAFVTPKTALTGEGPIKVTIECRDVEGRSQWASGMGVIKSKRDVTGNSQSVRVGMKITWDDSQSQTKVIKHCYVVEQYVARQRHWLRTEERFVVLLPAKVNGYEAKCVDVSEHGASFITELRYLEIANKGEVLDVVVGDDIAGRAEIRTITDLHDGDVRIGCSILWEDVDWIQAIERAEEKIEHDRKKKDKHLPPLGF